MGEFPNSELFAVWEGNFPFFRDFGNGVIISISSGAHPLFSRIFLLIEWTIVVLLTDKLRVASPSLPPSLSTKKNELAAAQKH